MAVEVDWETVKDNASKLMQWTYWLVGILIAFVISYVLYTRFNKQVASILVFIATMMALYYYYVKWFIVGNPLPMHVTFCPDFLTSLGPVDASSDQFVCVDKSGQTSLKMTGNNSEMKVETLKGDQTYAWPSPVPAGGHVSASGKNYVITPSSKATGAEIKTFCGLLTSQKLSWLSLCGE